MANASEAASGRDEGGVVGVLRSRLEAVALNVILSIRVEFKSTFIRIEQHKGNKLSCH
jgi:hypothetical protein